MREESERFYILYKNKDNKYIIIILISKYVWNNRDL